MTETYTLGYEQAAIAFVQRRRLDPNGAFFLPYLAPGAHVLDCGCGPGTLTLDIAERIGSGTVVGVDMNQSQVQLATRRASEQQVSNAFHSLTFSTA